MWIVAIAWIYVALMMALAEATNPQGSWLGAAITFFAYGVGPLALTLYLLGAPARRRALRARERADWEARQAETAKSAVSDGPDGASGAHVPVDGVAQVRPAQSMPPDAP